MWEGAQSGCSHRDTWRGEVCDSIAGRQHEGPQHQGRSEHGTPPASQPAQSAPLNVESVRATLATIEAGLQPWHAHGCLDPDTSEDLEVPREVRSLATLMAMYGIGIVVRCAWTVD